MRPNAIFFLLLQITCAVGCAPAIYEWHDVTLYSPPWIGPGKQIAWQERLVFIPFESRVLPNEYRMLDDAHHLIGGYSEDWNIANQVSAALRTTPVWNQWPPYESKSDIRQPPFAFALVSLRPTVVLVWNPGTADVWKLMRQMNPDAAHYDEGMRDPHIPGLATPLVFTAAIPPVDEVFWFSPDLATINETFQEAQRLDATHLRIELPADELILQRTTSAWIVTRQLSSR